MYFQDVSTVWTRSFPRFSYQGGVRSVNVTGDRVQDIVLGFGTGADGYNVPDVVCDVYFPELEKGRAQGRVDKLVNK